MSQRVLGTGSEHKVSLEMTPRFKPCRVPCEEGHNKTNCPQSEAVQGCWLWPRARRQQNICSCAATERCEREPDYRNSRNSRNTSFSLTGAGWAHSPPPSTVTHWSCVHQWICHTTTADNNNRSYYYLLITIFRVFTSVVGKNVHNK